MYNTNIDKDVFTEILIELNYYELQIPEEWMLNVFLSINDTRLNILIKLSYTQANCNTKYLLDINK